MSTLKERELRRTVIEQATDWHRRQREGRRSATEQAEFIAWLKASPQNTHEYLGVARLWGGLKGAMADLGLDEQALLGELRAEGQGNVYSWGATPVRGRGSQSRWRPGLIGLAAACVLLVGTAVYYLAPASLTGRPQVLTAQNDRPQRFRLEDGSVVHLNVDARVKVRYSRDARRIELERGQAFFDVAREAHRPFRVEAGATDVIAVGTRFDVAQTDGRLTVTVLQGRVDVGAIQLKAGQQVRFEGGRASEPAMADIRAATAWMRHEVIFDVQPLSDVVREFNRYLETPIRIEDQRLNQVEVSGVFDTYDVETFLIFLRQYDVDIEERRDAIHIFSRK